MKTFLKPSHAMSLPLCVQPVGMASAAARKKGGCVRQENACLIADERFRSNLDALQFQPEASDLQVGHASSPLTQTHA